MKAIKLQWYLIKNNMLPVLYLVLMSSVITLHTENLILSSLISSTMIGVRLISIPFQIDAEEKLDKFYGALPISRQDYVVSRYTFLLLMGIMGILITIGTKILILRLWKNYLYTPKEFIIAFIIGLVFYILTISLQLPLYYKYGSLKANLFSMIPVLIFLCFYLLFKHANFQLYLVDLMPYIKSNLLVSGIVTLFISLLLISISYYISRSIDKRGARNEK